ncbi:MAG: nuclear transport factor 2 family protein [Actinobacteria bacterium]|nr:MAG: nuclear transport factor 2 family protein [Actinomycetota bacterium]RIK07183.1 MAG: DUF1348 domain-containing protein [Acidobacteriota bacterium]
MDRLGNLAEAILGAWNTQDVEQVLDCYTADLTYLDPNTHGPVVGREAMRAYLTKLFDRWTMTWKGGEMLQLEGGEGVVIHWTATLTPTGSENSIEIAGLDLVILEGDLVKRNEVYFDRAALGALLSTGV